MGFLKDVIQEGKWPYKEYLGYKKEMRKIINMGESK